ncbi:MAG TPA: SIMPL domain-containing protein [Cytophagales bacterium]|nr:SIMPL domain-containing protein [Cytophagales bacterium]
MASRTKIINNEEDNKAKQTLEEIEESMIRKLQQLEINLDSALKVIDIASNLKQYWLAKDNIFTSKEYLLLVHDATTAGRVFRELETINISNITIQLLEHSKIEYFRKLVKIEAVKAAKAKAEAMSNAIGQSAGRALYIEELNSVNRFQGYMPGVANTIMVRGTSEIYGNRSPGPIIEFGKLELEYKVMARFKLN